MPKELLDNPDCYTHKGGITVPTDSATDAEKKAIKRLNKTEEWRLNQEKKGTIVG